MPTPRVLILFNEPTLPIGHPDRESEADVLYSVKIVRESLTTLEIPHAEYGVTDDIPALLERLKLRDFDVLFNLYEGSAVDSATEIYFTGLLEWLGLAYTGCPSLTLALARNKPLAKQLMRGAGILTPEFQLVTSNEFPLPEFAFPYLIKPAHEDASIGIDQASVVTNEAELKARVAVMLDRFKEPLLVERYIAGRELQISLVEFGVGKPPSVLPPSEIAFLSGPDAPRWPIYSYTAKWDENSAEYKHAPVNTEADIPSEWLEKIAETSRRTYFLLGARDYARIDTRITPEGDVYVLELNPNPSITSVMIDQGLPNMGRTYDEFVKALVFNAAARAQSRSMNKAP